jgi:hypothetical protein
MTRGEDTEIQPADRKVFDAATGNFDGVSLKVKLEFNTSIGPNAEESVFKRPSLKPLTLERSDRFRRGFGWDRIACADLPAFKNAPAHIRSQKAVFFDALNQWLDPDKPKIFLGRIWNVIHVKYFNAGKKAKKEERETLCRVFLFASSGCNLSPLPPNPWRKVDMGYQDAIKWFLPLDKLQDEPWAKTAARLDLGA